MNTMAARREWLGLAVLALPTLLLSVDVSVLFLALPRLSTDLGADSTEQLWILDIYSFLLAGFLVTMGTLGDRIGRRRLLLIGAAAFGAVPFRTSSIHRLDGPHRRGADRDGPDRRTAADRPGSCANGQRTDAADHAVTGSVDRTTGAGSWTERAGARIVSHGRARRPPPGAWPPAAASSASWPIFRTAASVKLHRQIGTMAEPAVGPPAPRRSWRCRNG